MDKKISELTPAQIISINDEIPITNGGQTKKMTIQQLSNIVVGGDMLKSVYDVDNTGVVDNAETIQIIGRNATGSTLYKGTVIYISGSTGNRPNFVKAKADTKITSEGTFGVIADDILNNTDGYCITIGYNNNLDTRSNATNPFTSDTLVDGDTVYLSPITAGYVTNVKPSAPNHLVYIGKVTRTSPTNGTIVYRIQNGYELEELHNVAISSVTDQDFLQYETATTLWKNKQLTSTLIKSKLGVTTLSGSNTGDETSTTIKSKLGITTLSGSNTGDETTATIKTKLGVTTLSGSNTGDETQSTIQSKLGITTLSGSNTGDQDLTPYMVKSANGTDIVDIRLFRANIGQDKLVNINDANYTILSNDKAVVTNATFTAPRTFILPLANSVNAGYEIIVADLFGAINGVNNISISTTGSDSINGIYTISINAPYGMRRLISNGGSKWTYDAGVLRSSNNLSDVISPSTALANIGGQPLLNYTPTKIVIRDTLQSTTLTGTITETLIGTYLIPANTFSAIDGFRISSFVGEKVGVLGTYTMKVKIGTTNVFSASTTISTTTNTATVLFASVSRNSLNLRSGNLKGYSFTNSAISDGSVTTLPSSSTAFNPTIDNYVFTSLTLASATDSTYQTNFLLTN